MANIFTQHLKSVNKSYWQHCYFALWFALHMLFCGIALIIHAIFPFLLIETGSKGLEKMIAHYESGAPHETL